jgi:hypothetical protein
MRLLVRELRVAGKSCGKGVCRLRRVGGPLQQLRFQDLSKENGEILRAPNGSRDPASDAGGRVVSLDEHRSLLRTAGRFLDAFFSTVIQDKLDGGGEIVEAIFTRFTLAIRLGNLRTKGDEPFAIALNDRCVAISHMLILTGFHEFTRFYAACFHRSGGKAETVMPLLVSMK